MKKLVLMAAGALPLMFVACTNELENVAVEETQQAPQEIVGANLVSKGMTISVNRGDGVDSRLDNDGHFVDGDKVGLAWYKANTASTIYDAQLDPLTHNWTDYLAVAPSDNKIFGNHKFTKEGTNFATDANVYEGFHYAYYPYAYEKQVAKKIVTPNAKPQKGTATEELYNEAFYISAQDSLLATSANEDGTISKTFNLAKVVWGLNFKLTPAEDILAMNYLKDFQIRQVEIQTGGDAWDAQFFNPTAQIIPGNLPYALYDDETGEYDGEKTEKQLYDMNLYGEYTEEKDNNLAFAFTESAGMMTTVVENPAIMLNAANAVRMFLFPTDEFSELIKPEELAVEVKVDCGKFRLYCEDETSTNGQALKKLREFLSTGIGGNANKKASKLSNANIDFTFDLTGADFEPDFTSITNIEEWENAVKLVKDLKLENPEFTVDGNVEFTGSIPMPEDGVVVNTTAEGQLNVIGDVVLPENLTMDAADKFVVSANATLTVEDGVELTANVINNGTIKAGKKSLISKVENNKRIEVVYGSYVEVEQGKEGTIAYEVLKSGETPARVNTLINGGNNGKYARVNTLVINKGVTFDLMMSTTASSEEDPYYNGVTTTNVVTDLKDINIEMNGGTIKGEKELTKSVKEIKVISGTNTVKDINVVTDLSVEEGAKVTIDATDHYHGLSLVKHDVIVGEDLSNKGQVTATTNVRVKNIDNEEGKTVVNSGYTVWYSNAYIQGGIAQGNILKTNNVTEIVTIPASANVEELKSSLASATEGSKVYLPADAEFDFSGEQYNFGGNTKASEVVSIIGKENTVIKGNTAKVFYFTLSDKSKDLILKDLTIEDGYTGSGNQATIWIRPDGCSENSIVNIVLENVNCESVMLEAGYVDGITYNVTLKNCDIEKVDAHAFKNNDWTTYNNVTVEGGNVNVVKGGSAPENVTVTKK